VSTCTRVHACILYIILLYIILLYIIWLYIILLYIILLYIILLYIILLYIILLYMILLYIILYDIIVCYIIVYYIIVYYIIVYYCKLYNCIFGVINSLSCVFYALKFSVAAVIFPWNVPVYNGPGGHAHGRSSRAPPPRGIHCSVRTRIKSLAGGSGGSGARVT